MLGKKINVRGGKVQNKSCKSCNYVSLRINLEPCKSCENKNNWLARECEVKLRPNKSKIHENICKELTRIYAKKNNDYGDSYSILRKEYENQILVRIFDKYNRLKTLKSGVSQQVNDESIRDSLLDLANYCIMELVEMEEEDV